MTHERQTALIDDLTALATRLVPADATYRHNDARYSNCERGNAQAHVRAVLFGRAVALGIENGALILGCYQSIILAEFDGPRTRELTIQIVGDDAAVR